MLRATRVTRQKVWVGGTVMLRRTRFKGPQGHSVALSRQRLTEGEGSEKRSDRWTCAWGRALEVTLQQFSMSGRSIARSFDQLDDQYFVLDLVASDKRDPQWSAVVPGLLYRRRTGPG